MLDGKGKLNIVGKQKSKIRTLKIKIQTSSGWFDLAAPAVTKRPTCPERSQIAP